MVGLEMVARGTVVRGTAGVGGGMQGAGVMVGLKGGRKAAGRTERATCLPTNNPQQGTGERLPPRALSRSTAPLTARSSPRLLYSERLGFTTFVAFERDLPSTGDEEYDVAWPVGHRKYALWAYGPLSEASTPEVPVVLYHG